MKRVMTVGLALALFAGGGIVGAAATQGRQEKKRVVFVDSAKADFKEVMPGVAKVVLWGETAKGPFGVFTKFAPGLHNRLHVHTNDIRIVVVSGAYLFRPEGGKEVRVGAGDYILVPGGTRHESGGDPKEGALFYEESPGGFDLKFVE